MSDDLHGRLKVAIEEKQTDARKLLRYSQENALTLADPKWLGREVPGWHEWPAVEAMLELSLRQHEAALRQLDRHWREEECTMRDCLDVEELAEVYGVPIDVEDVTL